MLDQVVQLNQLIIIRTYQAILTVCFVRLNATCPLIFRRMNTLTCFHQPSLAEPQRLAPTRQFSILEELDLSNMIDHWIETIVNKLSIRDLTFVSLPVDPSLSEDGVRGVLS